MTLKLAVWDVDGTLVDSDAEHLVAFQRAFAPHGIELDRLEYAANIMGASNAVIARRYLACLAPREQAATLDAKEAAYRDALGDLEPIPGAMALLDYADRRGLERAVVTNAPRANAEKVMLAAFRADPERNALRTGSGKLEIFSETIAGFGYADCPGHPIWQPPQEWLGGERARDYPLHLLSNQPATRLHSQYDHGVVSRESKIAGREPITINQADAASRGIAAGDIVRVFNDRGACLAGVRLTRECLRGIAVLATGAWLDPLDPAMPGSLCVHGNPNVLTQDVGTSRLTQGPSAQSCLVEVERWDGPLPPITVHAPPPIAAA